MLCQIYKYSSKMSYTHRRGCPRLILGCLNQIDIKTFIKQMDSSRCHYRSNDKKSNLLYLVGAPVRTRRRPANFPTIFPRLFILRIYILTIILIKILYRKNTNLKKIRRTKFQKILTLSGIEYFC